MLTAVTLAEYCRNEAIADAAGSSLVLISNASIPPSQTTAIVVPYCGGRTKGSASRSSSTCDARQTSSTPKRCGPVASRRSMGAVIEGCLPVPTRPIAGRRRSRKANRNCRTPHLLKLDETVIGRRRRPEASTLGTASASRECFTLSPMLIAFRPRALMRVSSSLLEITFPRECLTAIWFPPVLSQARLSCPRLRLRD